MAIFGYDAIGSGVANFGTTGAIYGTNFTTPANCESADSMTVYFEMSGGRASTVWTAKLAIYRLSDGALIGATEERFWDNVAPDPDPNPNPPANGWYTFNFSPALTLVPSTAYILVGWGQITGSTLGSPVFKMKWTADASYDIYAQDIAYTGTFPDPHGLTDIADGKFAIYATYTPTGINFQINIGDAWKAISAMQINIGDVWKPVSSAKINIGDAWKTIF